MQVAWYRVARLAEGELLGLSVGLAEADTRGWLIALTVWEDCDAATGMLA